jgi:hypothetical protein
MVWKLSPHSTDQIDPALDRTDFCCDGIFCDGTTIVVVD